MRNILILIKNTIKIAIYLNIAIMQLSLLFNEKQIYFTDLVNAQNSNEPFYQNKEVAVTIDDLPFVFIWKYDSKALNNYTFKLLKSLKENNVPAIGFVVEKTFYKDSTTQDTARISLLKMWLDEGMELGNHTYSHPDLHSLSLADYEKDFLQGNKITKELMSKRNLQERYFRHPFLHTGRDIETRTKFEKFLSDNGYSVAPVTIDDADWIFNSAYEKADNNNDSVLMNKISVDYISYMKSKFEFFERESRELFNRNIKQILLIHANHLNADHFGELAKMMKDLNYKFISLEKALQDSAYKSPDTFIGRGGISWIHRWAITAGKKKDFFRGEPLTPDYIMNLAGVTEE